MMKKKGFTLVESLIAITVLVLVTSGVSSAVQTGLSSYTFSKEQVAAFYLAQEGVEQIRNQRDTNRLAGDVWLDGISYNSTDPCYFGNYCYVDAVENTVDRCPGSDAESCPRLRQDTISGLFGHDSSWPETNFRRAVSISNISADEVAILVTVEWSKGLVTREFRVRENILNW